MLLRCEIVNFFGAVPSTIFSMIFDRFFTLVMYLFVSIETPSCAQTVHQTARIAEVQNGTYRSARQNSSGAIEISRDRACPALQLLPTRREFVIRNLHRQRAYGTRATAATT